MAIQKTQKDAIWDIVSMPMLFWALCMKKKRIEHEQHNNITKNNESITNKCSLEEFTIFFLNLVRSQTEDFQRGSLSSLTNTPQKIKSLLITENEKENINTVEQLTSSSSSTHQEQERFPGKSAPKICNKVTLLPQIQTLKESPLTTNYIATNIEPKLTTNINLRNLQSSETQTTPIASSCVQVLKSQNSSTKKKITLLSHSTIIDSTDSETNSTVQQKLINSSLNSTFDNSLQLKSSPIIQIKKKDSKKPALIQEHQPHQSDFNYNALQFPTPNKSFENRFKSNTSTPIRKSNRSSDNNNSSTISNSTDTDRLVLGNNSYSPSVSKNRNTSFCLGDYILNTTSPVGQTKQKKNNKQLFGETEENPSKIISSVVKPKRRVQPTQVLVNDSTLAGKFSTFSSPAFRSENNILGISKDEIVDRENCPIRQERAKLKTEKSTIVKEFESETSIVSKQKQSHLKYIQDRFSSKSSSDIIELPTGNEVLSKTCSDTVIKIDFTKLKNKNALNRLIEIHSALIHLNLIINDLNELSYLLNFLNYSDFDNYTSPSIELKDANVQTSHRIEIPNKNDCIAKNEGFSSSSSSVLKTNEEEDGPKIEILAEYTQLDSKLINYSDGCNIIDSDTLYTILKNFTNCLYYARGVLNKQKNLLALLDVITLRVILDNEHLEIFDDNLKEFLSSIYAHKIQLENLKSKSHETSFKIGRNFQTVFYQQEHDTKDNFLSENEFRAFKKQRDLFYEILKIWESKHLNHLWNFETELKQKIQNLLNYMDSPINMAHLAKLFTSQLIISSSNFSESPSDLEISLPNIDLSKLSKLRQRLVAPSNFSVDYQFPGIQAFFKDFLMTTNSIIFLEQLKCVLINELIEMNNSSYEIVNLSSDNKIGDIKNDDDDYKGKDESVNNGKDKEDSQVYNDYVVRPETILTMRVLGKFLGLLIAQPFNYEGNLNSIVDNRQIELRSILRPEFDVLKIMQTSILHQKLIVTIPWLVQFLSMLDHVTLRLPYYRKLMENLFELYENLNYDKNNKYKTSITSSSSMSLLIQKSCIQMRPTSKFILRLCLGWLFENLNMTQLYYIYRRQMRCNGNLFNIQQINNETPKNIDEKITLVTHNATHQVLINMPENCRKLFQNTNEIISITKMNKINDNEINCTLLTQRFENTNSDEILYKRGTKSSSSSSSSSSFTEKPTEFSLKELQTSKTTESINADSIQTNLKKSFHPLLENVLNVSCPFLADFRVVIMPIKSSKCVSRTGRYRHITTKISSELSSSPAISTSSTIGKDESNNSKQNPNFDAQTKLIEAFLHSQNMSLRRIVEFVIERTTSAVIKDFQMEFLLPSKAKAFEIINEIELNELEIVMNEIYKILSEIYNKTMTQWDKEIPKMIDCRIKKALDALLPNETLDAVKQTCVALIKKKCECKTNDWRLINLNGLEFYSKDIQADAEKHLKTFVNINTEQQFSTILEIDYNELAISRIFSKLKFFMHFSNLQPQCLNVNDLTILLVEVESVLKSGHKLPRSFFRIAGMMTICLAQNLILREFNVLSTSVLDKFINIWQIEEFQQFIDFEKFKNCENDIDFECDNIFNSFLSESYFRLLLHTSECYLMFSEMLIILLSRDLMTLNYLNHKFTKLFKLEWNKDEYKKLTKILENVSRNSQIQQNDAHTILYTEMLMDLIKDIDKF